jgi:hypothetical protein
MQVCRDSELLTFYFLQCLSSSKSNDFGYYFAEIPSINIITEKDRFKFYTCAWLRLHYRFSGWVFRNRKVFLNLMPDILTHSLYHDEYHFDLLLFFPRTSNLCTLSVIIAFFLHYLHNVQ